MHTIPEVHAQRAFRLNVLGGAALLDATGSPIGQQRRRIGLLAMIAAAGDLGVTRDRLMARLSPESPPELARHALQQLLYYIRHQIGPDVILDTDPLRLNPAVITSDMWDFERALNQGALAEAVAVYRGPFLDGFHLADSHEFEEWSAAERARLAARHVDALSRLATDADARGERLESIEWWKRLTALDPLDGRATLGLIRALAAAGDGPGAVRQAHAHGALVQSELGRAPDPAIAQLVAALSVERRVDSAVAHPDAVLTDTLKGSTSAPAPLRRTNWLGHRMRPVLAAGAVLAVLGAATQILRSRGEEMPAYPRTALALLPFRNLSVDTAHAYFTGGLHDELLTQLSKVAALSVRGRTSVMSYAGTSKPIRQIAEELQVGTLLDASVQVVGERLRVSVQLIDAATENHIWAERYDGTVGEAFVIQSDIAQRVAVAVGAALSRGEQRAVAAAPTMSTEAYLFYLQGREYLHGSRTQRDLESAQQLFRRALLLDSTFALAHADLSEVHGLLYWLWYDRSPARAAAQHSEAEAARRLAPNLPQAHRSLGLWHYWGRREYAAALAELDTALRGLPNDAKLITLIGAVNRRLGNWNEAYAAFERATELDPRDQGVLLDLGHSFLSTRRYADAILAYDRALALAPDTDRAGIAKGLAFVLWHGQLDTLRTALERIITGDDLGAGLSAARVRAHLLLWERDADRLLRHVENIRGRPVAGDAYFYPKALYAAWAHRLRGDSAAARRAFHSARLSIDSMLPEGQDDRRVHVARGLALAGLGLHAEAIREARWLEHTPIYRDDAHWGPVVAEQRAQILAQAGQADVALDAIEHLLRGNSHLTVHSLRLDPLWDPLRGHPRFRALVAKHSAL
jgi:TolB-like protein/DNA-binding SARP family transcriptional activator